MTSPTDRLGPPMPSLFPQLATRYVGFGGPATAPWLKIDPPVNVPAGGSTRVEFDDRGLAIGFRTYDAADEEIARYRWSNHTESFVLVIPKWTAAEL